MTSERRLRVERPSRKVVYDVAMISDSISSYIPIYAPVGRLYYFLEAAMSELGVRDYEPDSPHVPERLTLRLSPEARKTLEWLAEERHVSLAEVIRRALGTEKFFIEMQKKNAKILIDIPGERIKEVVHL